MAVSFSPEASERIHRLLAKYPNKMAGTLPVLWIAQEEFGWISDEVIALVANTLELPASHVLGVVTFYTMYNRRPVGRYHVQVCTNISCMLRGGNDVLERFRRKLSIGCKETTADGLFTLSEVECLAACGGAPCVQVNDRYYEPVRPEDVDALVDRLRSEAAAQVVAGQAARSRQGAATQPGPAALSSTLSSTLRPTTIPPAIPPAIPPVPPPASKRDS